MVDASMVLRGMVAPAGGAPVLTEKLVGTREAFFAFRPPPPCMQGTGGVGAPKRAVGLEMF